MTRADAAMQGVVLSSGGGDGAYAVGVLKALCNGRSPATGFEPLDPRVFVGSSIGAFSAAVMVSHSEAGPAAAAARLEEAWLEGLAYNSRTCRNGAYRFRVNPLDLFDPRCFFSNPVQTFADLTQDSGFLLRDGLARLRDFTVSDEPLERRSLQLFNLASFVSSESFPLVIERAVRFENIRRAATALRVVATDWDEGGLKVFSNEDMTDELGERILAASAALPGFFRHVTIDGQVYVDAAVLGYTRLAPAIEAGADTLHVIYVDTDVRNIPLAALESTAETLYRVFAVQWADNVDTSVEAIGRINRQIDVLERLAGAAGLSEEAQALFYSALFTGPQGSLPGGRPLRKIAVHRYHPEENLFGPLGVLNFNRRRLEGLIERGFRDAVGHDCVRERCVPG